MWLIIVGTWFAINLSIWFNADDCLSYTTSGGTYKYRENCMFFQFCCGTCENRYCCSKEPSRLSDSAQVTCIVKTMGSAAIGLTIAGIGIVFVVIIICCCCCCSCCCENPRPVVGTTTTTVVNTQCAMQPPMVQGGQYPAYQPVPTQPAYAGQPMPAGHYQTQPYVAEPPPPYHTVAGPGQPSYLIHTPAQEGFAYPLLTDALNQPAYNMQSPNCGY
ncbi:hypothetical protein IRJ41_006727 [Triplophysa rosa]|uniref:Shisa N-terminal domain-containing protein n=1 Tax=Triplophysa rosa TaxID=992332 RepID=A0A9W7WAI1_TRIRA|nr:hypothetical protein IRJ41_006727 [Triplophysa rosa]